MSDKTGIAWCDATWGCELRAEPPQTISASIMPGNESPHAPYSIEPSQCCSAPTLARDYGVSLIRATPRLGVFWFRGMMPLAMLPTSSDLKVPRCIICFVPIQVMDNLALRKRPPKQRRRDEAMFVDIASYVGKGMPRGLDKHIPVRRDGSPAAPIGVSFSRMYCSHTAIIQAGVLFRRMEGFDAN